MSRVQPVRHVTNACLRCHLTESAKTSRYSAVQLQLLAVLSSY
jgi:nitrate reductase cytochrome c-type subunit